MNEIENRSEFIIIRKKKLLIISVISLIIILLAASLISIIIYQNEYIVRGVFNLNETDIDFILLLDENSVKYKIERTTDNISVIQVRRSDITKFKLCLETAELNIYRPQ